MIRISVTEPNTDEWKKWRKKCSDAQTLIIEEMKEWLAKWVNIPNPTEEQLKEKRAEKPKVKESVYNDKKIKQNFYVDPKGPFRGRCVYCETSIEESRQPGHLDHFRPKGSVRDRSSAQDITISINGTAVSHPGYYWLCYDWRNLLPTCHECNSPSTGRTGEKFGKHDFFPIEDEHKRAAQPGDESTETPLLINPLEEEPATHLYMDKTGTMFHRTEKGRTSIETFGLNDEGLLTARKKVYDDLKNKTVDYSIKMQEIRRQGLNTTPYLTDLLVEIKARKDGGFAYTMAARLGIEDGKQEAKELQEKALELL